MAKNTKIDIGVNDTVTLVLPGGQEVSILLSCLDPLDQLPELDIELPQLMSVNCFKGGLVPAQPDRKDKNVLESKQLVIPIEGLFFDENFKLSDGESHPMKG